MNTTDTCSLCAHPSNKFMQAQILGKYTAEYHHCSHCGFVQVENPHWLAEAYEQAINAEDTGIAMRNLEVSRRLAILLHAMFGKRDQDYFVDVAGGYGLLVRLMRDYGFDFLHSDKWCDNLFASTFDYTPNDHKQPARAVTAIEVLEHLVDPIEFLDRVFAETGTDTFIFTTELYTGSQPPALEDWSYFGVEHGQHIAFYSANTLAHLASRYKLQYSQILGLHIFSPQPVKLLRKKLLWGTLTETAAAEWVRWRRGNLFLQDSQKLRYRNGKARQPSS